MSHDHLSELAEENADLEREIAILRRERDEARAQSAARELEVHALRRELQALRMSKDTERLSALERA